MENPGYYPNSLTGRFNVENMTGYERRRHKRRLREQQRYDRWAQKQLHEMLAERNATQTSQPTTSPTAPEPRPNPYAPGGELHGQLVELAQQGMNNFNQGMANTQAQADNVFNTSAGAFNTGIEGLEYASNPMAVPASMNMFLNPYRNQVLSNALLRQRDDMAMNLNNVRGQAAQSRAFGGARQGLVEAELMDRYNQNAGELAARVMQQGFDRSADLALQNLSQNRIASQALVNAAPVGFNMGTQAIGQQMQAGEMQQRMMQNILNLASGQYDQLAAGPSQQLRTAIMGSQGNPLAGRSMTTEQFNPGMLQFMQFGAGLLGGK